MVNKIVIVTGAHGQDGTIISQKLLDRGDKVFGFVKKNSIPKVLYPHIEYIDTENLDYSKIYDLIKKINPHEIYNFMGVTNVINPWDSPHEVYKKNFLHVLNILESVKNINKKIKILQSSSSLIFGNTEKNLQNEDDLTNPIYHYGFSKKFADDLIKVYRKEFGIFCCSAIFYNHESEFRGENFFTKKLIRESYEIVKGTRDYVLVGNVDAYRDYGYAGDYMDACIKILEQDKPDDYIISSGQQIKILDLINIVFNKLGLDINKHLIIDKNLLRLDNLSNLCGDNSKIKSIGWSPKTSLGDMIDKMINYEKSTYNRN